MSNLRLVTEKPSDLPIGECAIIYIDQGQRTKCPSCSEEFDRHVGAWIQFRGDALCARCFHRCPPLQSVIAWATKWVEQEGLANSGQ